MSEYVRITPEGRCDAAWRAAGAAVERLRLALPARGVGWPAETPAPPSFYLVPKEEVAEWLAAARQLTASLDELVGVTVRTCVRRATPEEARRAERSAPLCSVCRKPQRTTPSGLVCADDHGGAPSLPDPF